MLCVWYLTCYHNITIVLSLPSDIYLITIRSFKILIFNLNFEDSMTVIKKMLES
jgi:hypothetical protein